MDQYISHPIEYNGIDIINTLDGFKRWELKLFC